MPPNWKQGDKDIFFNSFRDKSIDEQYTIPLGIHNYEKLCDIILESGLKKMEYFNLLMVIDHIYSLLYLDITYNEELAELESEILDEYNYEEDIRPEMLQLYNFINNWKKAPKNEPIIIKWGSKTIKLDNVENWIPKAINTYFRFDNLCIDSVDEATDELTTRYSKKTGRKVLNKYQTLLIYGIDKLYQKATNSEEITNQQCVFIRNYLKYLDIPISEDDFDHDDDIKNIRSKIRYMRKNSYPVKWSEYEIEFE